MTSASRNIIIILLGIILVVESGCSGYKELIVGDVKEVRFSKFDKGKLGLEVDIPIENPSKMKFNVTKVDISIRLNELPVGIITSREKILIEKKSDKIYTFPLDVNISGLSGGAKILLSVAGKGKANIEAKGHLKVRYFIFGTKIPVYSKEELNLY